MQQKRQKIKKLRCIKKKKYEDLHLVAGSPPRYKRKKIRRETENLSGIYLILNKVTLDYYIGSAATNRFYVRFSNHLLNFHGSKIVKLAVKKKYKLPHSLGLRL